MTIKQIKLAAQVRGFYDIPVLKIKESKPDYYNLFSWTKKTKYKFITFDEKEERIQIGRLKENLFDTIEKKIAYIQGIFEDSDYDHGVKNGKNWIHFANSQNTVERCKKWINDIAYANNLFNAILEHNITYTTPICHQVVINPVVVDFIKNYKFKELE